MEGKPRGKFPSVQRTRILLFFIKKADCMLSKSDLWEREWGNCLMIEAKMYIQIFFFLPGPNLLLHCTTVLNILPTVSNSVWM